MNPIQIQKLNEGFQKQAVQLSELIPSTGLLQATQMLLSGTRKINDYFIKLQRARSEAQFNIALDKLEEEIDEMVYILDQLEIANKKQKISSIEDFLKEGYELMSIYSKCCDYIIEQKIAKEEEWTNA